MPTTDKYNGISSDAVQAKTGKTWPEWFRVLDAAGGKTMDHKGIVAVLDTHGVGSWWQQMVTVGYEQARGRRVKHETAAGFSVSRSKTIAVPIGQLFAAWKDRRKRARWLADPDYTVRTATSNRSMRITWIDGKTHVDVGFFEKGTGKSQVAVEHSKLASAKQAEKMKTYWAKQLDKLQALLIPSEAEA